MNPVDMTIKKVDISSIYTSVKNVYIGPVFTILKK